LRRAGCAISVSVVVGLGIAELVARRVFGVPLSERMPLMEVRANPARGFEMIPESEHYTYLERVRVDNLGLRGEDIGAKAAGEVRILALGDSMTYGQGMGEDETLPHAIETELAARLRPAQGPAGDRAGTKTGESPTGARSVRVINGGVRAYNTRQELALLAELGPRIVPDVVVLFWFANDIEETDIDAMYRRFEKSGPVVFDLGEPLSGWGEFTWKMKQFLRQSALIMQARHAYTDAHWPQPSAAALDLAFQRLDRYFDEFARLARAGGFELVVAVVPLSRTARQADAEHPLTGRVKALAEAHHFPFLDLVGPVRELCRRAGKPPVLPYDGHYDARANEALGKYVATRIWTLFPGRFTSQ
jgi:lysophospholipase L1-like esterase